MKITAIIIEDEIDAQELLTSIIKHYCPNIKLLGIASNNIDAVNLIKSLQPDLLFLDINLGKSCGFTVLDNFLIRPFKVIITTAYQEYAIQAFKYNAVDYILKPYAPSTVKLAVERVSEMKEKDFDFKNLEIFLNTATKPAKISFPTHDGVQIFKVDEIIRIEADRAYCCIYIEGGEQKIISKSLKEVEALLPDYFFRSHAAHLLNLDKLVKYAKEDGGYALMNDGSKIPIARRRKVDFLNLIHTV